MKLSCRLLLFSLLLCWGYTVLPVAGAQGKTPAVKGKGATDSKTPKTSVDPKTPVVTLSKVQSAANFTDFQTIITSLGTTLNVAADTFAPTTATITSPQYLTMTMGDSITITLGTNQPPSKAPVTPWKDISFFKNIKWAANSGVSFVLLCFDAKDNFIPDLTQFTATIPPHVYMFVFDGATGKKLGSFLVASKNMCDANGAALSAKGSTVTWNQNGMGISIDGGTLLANNSQTYPVVLNINTSPSGYVAPVAPVAPVPASDKTNVSSAPYPQASQIDSDVVTLPAGATIAAFTYSPSFNPPDTTAPASVSSPFSTTDLVVSAENLAKITAGTSAVIVGNVVANSSKGATGYDAYVTAYNPSNQIAYFTQKFTNIAWFTGGTSSKTTGKSIAQTSQWAGTSISYKLKNSKASVTQDLGQNYAMQFNGAGAIGTVPYPQASQIDSDVVTLSAGATIAAFTYSPSFNPPYTEKPASASNSYSTTELVVSATNIAKIPAGSSVIFVGNVIANSSKGATGYDAYVTAYNPSNQTEYFTQSFTNIAWFTGGTSSKTTGKPIAQTSQWAGTSISYKLKNSKASVTQDLGQNYAMQFNGAGAAAGAGAKVSGGVTLSQVQGVANYAALQTVMTSTGKSLAVMNGSTPNSAPAYFNLNFGGDTGHGLPVGSNPWTSGGYSIPYSSIKTTSGEALSLNWTNGFICVPLAFDSSNNLITDLTTLSGSTAPASIKLFFFDGVSNTYTGMAAADPSQFQVVGQTGWNNNNLSAGIQSGANIENGTYPAALHVNTPAGASTAGAAGVVAGAGSAAVTPVPYPSGNGQIYSNIVTLPAGVTVAMFNYSPNFRPQYNSYGYTELWLSTENLALIPAGSSVVFVGNVEKNSSTNGYDAYVTAYDPTDSTHSKIYFTQEFPGVVWFNGSGPTNATTTPIVQTSQETGTLINYEWTDTWINYELSDGTGQNQNIDQSYAMQFNV